MPRPADLVVDPTPLDGPRVDVPARIGWLLRISRQVAGVSLADVADRLAEVAGQGPSVPVLSRLERSGDRNGQVVDAYEAALGLEPGRLRAAVDLVGRRFPYAPQDRAPALARPATLEAFDRVVDTVQAGAPTGGDWLALVREHEGGRPFGLPSREMAPLLERLAGETGRSVGTAFVTRREALKRLRCSPYGELLADLARESTADRNTQVHVDLVSIVAERPTAEALRWACGLLCSDSFLAVRGGAHAMERMSELGGIDAAVWPTLAPAFAEAVRRAGDDPDRRALLTSVLHTLPREFRRAVGSVLDAPLPRPRVPAAWTPTRRNAHFAYAEELARAVSQDVDVPEQPMLTRLLFEVLYDFRAARSVSSSVLLLASPFHRVLPRALQQAVVSAPDPTTRAGALSTAANMPMEWDGLDVDAWLRTGGTDVAAGALVVAGQSGVPLPEEVLERYLGEPRLYGRVTYSAGMAEHPVLERWAADPALPPLVSSAARWWRRHGGRVVR